MGKGFRNSRKHAAEDEEDEDDDIQLDVEKPGHEHPEWSPTRRCLLGFLENSITEYILSAVILMNLVLLVIETDYGGADGDEITQYVLDVTNRGMLVFFTIEIILRIYTFRQLLLHDPWALLDALVVAADLISTILSLVAGDLPTVGMCRIIRLVRLSRTSEIIAMVPQLNILVTSLVGALTPLFWGTALLAILLATFGILAVQIIHPINQNIDHDGSCERCPRAFASVWQSSLTFTQQIIAGDSWGLATLPIIEASPATFFFFAIVFISLNMAFMNVILASVVDAVTQARSSHDEYIIQEKRRDLIQTRKALKKTLKKMDNDGSGKLTYAEFENGFLQDPEFKRHLEVMDITLHDLPAVFSWLDIDGSGDVSHREFCDGIYKMKSSDEHTMIVFLMFYVSTMRKELQKMVNNMLQKETEAMKTIEGEERAIEEISKTLETEQNELEALNQRLSSPAPRSIGEALQAPRQDIHHASARRVGEAELSTGQTEKDMKLDCLGKEQQRFMEEFADSMKEFSKRIEANMAEVSSMLRGFSHGVATRPSGDVKIRSPPDKESRFPPEGNHSSRHPQAQMQEVIPWLASSDGAISPVNGSPYKWLI